MSDAPIEPTPGDASEVETPAPDAPVADQATPDEQTPAPADESAAPPADDGTGADAPADAGDDAPLPVLDAAQLAAVADEAAFFPAAREVDALDDETARLHARNGAAVSIPENYQAALASQVKTHEYRGRTISWDQTFISDSEVATMIERFEAATDAELDA